MDNATGLMPYTDKQQRMLEFLAAYHGHGVVVAEVERRIVALELDALEEVLGVYAAVPKPPKGKPKLTRVVDFPAGGA